MLSVLLTVAMAAELEVVGFSPTGHLVSVALVDEAPAGVSVTLQTLDVRAGTWNHLPARGTGAARTAAIDAAVGEVPPGYAVPRAVARRPTPLRTWAEGSRDHAHLSEHVTVHHVVVGAQQGALTLVERPTGVVVDGVVEVEPWLTWTAPGAAVGVERLADRVPRRWPRGAAAFELGGVWAGPRGHLLVALRVIDASGVSWLLATAPAD